MQLTEHFCLEEFTRSSTAKARGINNSLNPSAKSDLSVIRNIKNLCTHVLEPLRNHISQPLVISSGYRSPRLNAAVGGAANSQHLTGQAADLRIPSVAEARQWMRWIMDNTTFDQLILEHNKSGSHWIHVSCKPNPEDNRHQVISTLLKKS
ncbi:MAG: D-Ala-D-Ala carboxypeptidase family metallohydrolase [Prevotella sp.]